MPPTSNVTSVSQMKPTLSHGRPHVEPEDVEALFLPVLGHRILFTPAFLASTRKLPPGEALEEFRRRCFELVPRP